MVQFARLNTFALLVLSLAAFSQTSPARGHFDHATVLYDWVTNSHGEKLRTFVTRPNTTSDNHGSDSGKKVPVIFFVGWLSCDSMEYPDANTRDGFGIFIRRLIDESGYATVRMDKPGVGESQGDCAKADFKSEMEGWQAAFDAMSKYDFIDLDRVIMIGLSNGGGFSPMVLRDHPVRGFISCGSWGRTWYEHMLDLERRRMMEEGKSPSEVNTSIRAFVEFYTLYLMKGMTPGQVIAQHPEWKSLWYDSPDGQYGRPAAFYQQLQALNLGEVWQNVKVPVLVIRGTGDNIMSRPDAEAIVRTVNEVHPEDARYLQIDNLTHDMTVNGKFYDPLIPTVLDWMKEHLSAK
jgi:pimeloyl-ACP methyl ester carboxylesterase